MANGNEERRNNPPCDTHDLRINTLEIAQKEIKLTMYGEDGRGGVNQAINDVSTNTKTTNETVNGLKKMFYAFNIPVLIAVIGMAVKYIFFNGG